MHSSTSGGPPGFPFCQTRSATVCVLSFWVQWYPEAARLTSLRGAQVLFYPTAIGWHPSEQAEWGEAQADAWRTIQRSHAIANGVSVASHHHTGYKDEPDTRALTVLGRRPSAEP